MASTESHRTEKRATAVRPEIPDKLYFRIGEVARLLDVPTYVLRFWETEFPQLKPGKGGTGQRLYRRRDVESAFRIRDLLYEQGYTIPGARQYLRGEGRDSGATREPAAEPEMAGIPASIRLRRMRSELREIAALLARPSGIGSKQVAQSSRWGLHMAPRQSRPAEQRSSPLFPEDETSGQS